MMTTSFRKHSIAALLALEFVLSSALIAPALRSYKPAKRDGVAVEAEVRQKFTFPPD